MSACVCERCGDEVLHNDRALAGWCSARCRELAQHDPRHRDPLSSAELARARQGSLDALLSAHAPAAPEVPGGRCTRCGRVNDPSCSTVCRRDVATAVDGRGRRNTAVVRRLRGEARRGR